MKEIIELLKQVEQDELACLDGYGNAVAVNGKELVGYLKDIKQELENE